jgi:hypothetical protein
MLCGRRAEWRGTCAAAIISAFDKVFFVLVKMGTVEDISRA